MFASIFGKIAGSFGEFCISVLENIADTQTVSQFDY